MFFFSDPRCNFPKGKIQVQTDLPFYEPGGTVNGLIYLEIMEPLAAKHIELEIKGGEKTAFKRHYTETEEVNGEMRTHHRVQKCKHKKTFVHFKSKVFDIPDEMLQPGVYSVAFQTVLPGDIPSSLHF